MSLGFTGTQVGLTPKQRKTLEFILRKFVGVESKLRHGDCIGADDEANALARNLNFKTIAHPPISSKKRAFCEVDKSLPEKDYLDRNHDIVNCSKLLIACPRESHENLRSGTWATIRYARKMNKDLIIIFFDGTLRKEIHLQ